ncbi:MAG: hypothetical protein LBB08_01485 [Rickettsiales bacterium]|jgi:hypothetical protein|nr:hypothetical protein [Rickettsiales bacterium]
MASISGAQRRLAELLMDDMPLSECEAASTPLPPDWFMRFRAARAEFLKSLGDSMDELVMISLGREDFMSLLSARCIPENLAVRFRRPILYGGRIEPDNMFLITGFPYGFNLNLFMAEQIGSDKIFYPDPAKKVYVSSNILSGSDGGNATANRLEQGFAAQISQLGGRS